MPYQQKAANTNFLCLQVRIKRCLDDKPNKRLRLTPQFYEKILQLVLRFVDALLAKVNLDLRRKEYIHCGLNN